MSIRGVGFLRFFVGEYKDFSDFLVNPLGEFLEPVLRILGLFYRFT